MASRQDRSTTKTVSHIDRYRYLYNVASLARRDRAEMTVKSTKTTVTPTGDPAASTDIAQAESETPFVMERLTKRKDADRSFDIEFWQRQSFSDRINATFDLTYYYHVTVKGEDETQLRLQRSVETLRRKSR